MPDLTNALVAEWKQVPVAMFQHQVESLPRRVEAVIAAKRGPSHSNFGMRCLTNRCPHIFGHVVRDVITPFWPANFFKKMIIIKQEKNTSAKTTVFNKMI